MIVLEIKATDAQNGVFEVKVRDGAVTTTHIVAVPPGLCETLGWGHGRELVLVRRSFEFLLEREPATSILRRFSLDVIGDYFPEYAAEMTRRAGEDD